MAHETTQHDATAWAQVDGDVNASEYGVTFARWNEYGEYEIVKADYLPDHSSEFAHETNPYAITEFTFDVSYLDDPDMVRAINSCGMPADYEWTPEAQFLALFDYGKCDPRQPDTFF